MAKATSILTLLVAFLLAAACTTDNAPESRGPPTLILQITIDQLRGDLPTRYYDRLGGGGFRYLWENGVVYRNAHHAHANTETIVGHATLATGAHPSGHGMVGNLWFDRETGFTTYNVEDPNYRLLTLGADVDEDAEIDPTQRAARSEGRSPAAILVSTFSDELRSSTGGNSKVIGVSVKDRGAIAMAGHSGTAYWFSKSGGEFVTSRAALGPEVGFGGEALDVGLPKVERGRRLAIDRVDDQLSGGVGDSVNAIVPIEQIEWCRAG